MAQVGRTVKEVMVRELTEALKARPNFFVAAVGPLPAAETDTLRKRLRGANAQLLVVKRRLGLRGLSALKLNGQTGELFAGSVGLVLPQDDVVQAAKLLVEFAKTHDALITVRGGWVEGQLFDRKHLEELAALPPRPQLLAQLVWTIESPMADVIFTVERLIGDLAWMLEQAAATRPSAAPQESPAAAPNATAAPEAPPQPPAAPMTEQPSASGPEQQPNKEDTSHA